VHHAILRPPGSPSGLGAIGVDVVGISPDDPDKQLAFDRKYGLGFPLLADEDHAVADAWGTWGPKTREA
jgi:Peroxiredoxin